MNREKDIRWKQRYENFEKAFLLLKEAVEMDILKLSQLEKEGIIQRFEYTFELAWKVLKDKMEEDGIIMETISPKYVVRKAFEARYIDDAETWFLMIGDRNQMSHTYNFSKFEEIIFSIQNNYIDILYHLYETLKKQI
ncbi:nucleotidyltransferase substrate binding protein, family [Salinivirga cyanobacteriivorans]|uniref:Nucleotidyltransferase substrate binding protein, family n=1 Tax=Salinivirga cyanobacteriivorans TaxID=1307839 RepID=A0A0S2I0E2_9BACT|nr:nucleotidyltransferase substrate binding protein [Salinivirga cyanobacteriivorans]ALO15750.1 nucleotidyltransferase substrate binding protein, family [Salinivirga cyanobacteriivorans]